jgi:hypothetical protein
VNVPAGSKEPWTGMAIVATHRTSIAGPQGVDGPLTLYDARAITGEATHVDF